MVDRIEFNTIDPQYMLLEIQRRALRNQNGET